MNGSGERSGFRRRWKVAALVGALLAALALGGLAARAFLADGDDKRPEEKSNEDSSVWVSYWVQTGGIKQALSVEYLDAEGNTLAFDGETNDQGMWFAAFTMYEGDPVWLRARRLSGSGPIMCRIAFGSVPAITDELEPGEGDGSIFCQGTVYYPY